MSESSVNSDPLFVGLTRPTLIFGVSLNFAILNLCISALAFIQTNDLKVLLLAIALHLVGYIICFKDPRFIELYLNKFNKCNLANNKGYFGGNTYGI